MNQHLVSLDALAIRINEQQEQIEQAWGMTLELAKQAGEMLIEAKRLTNATAARSSGPIPARNCPRIAVRR